MRHSSGAPGAWTATQRGFRFPPLCHDLEVDTCIVGGGTCGLTIGYLLAQEGRSVAVLSESTIGSGYPELAAPQGSLPACHFQELERRRGDWAVQIQADSHQVALDAMEHLVKHERIDCGFRRTNGYLFLSDESGGPAFLRRELAAAQRAGMRDVEYLSRPPDVGFAIGRCLRFPHQGQFQPDRYRDGLSVALHRAGGHLHPHTRIASINGGPQAIVETTSGALVVAESVVIASPTPNYDRLTMRGRDHRHPRKPAVGLAALGWELPGRPLADGLFWEACHLGAYVLPHPQRAAARASIVIGTANEPSTTDAHLAERIARLEHWASRRFSGGMRNGMYWSSSFARPFGSESFIDRDPLNEPNVFLVAEDPDRGMTASMIAGLLMTDLLQGRPNPWQPLYDAGYKPRASRPALATTADRPAVPQPAIAP